ncbi:MAG: alpha/beta hydrolase [Parasphingopyxis sp.]|uniref:alpha/beta hydrolase n=1 Tax=Parasphingopyxis sp. TaxID=1920299 RepID=UPI003FA08424
MVFALRLLATLFCLLPTMANAQLHALDWDRTLSPFHGPERDVEFLLRSGATDEYREITVRVPAGYREGDTRYPVLYVTDADWNYHLAANYIEYLSYQHRIPEMIVVGIRNVDRNRDFVPRPSPSFPNTGGADRFVEFLAEELKPAVDERYRTSGFDILFGHSFGGTIATHVLLTRPETFDAYIALSTSTWVADRVLFEEAEAFFERGTSPDAFVYMAVAEGDGGATVPDGNAFAALFERRGPDSIEFHYEIVPETNHFTVVMPAFANALQTLYPAWGFENELRQRIEAEGAAAVDNWFAEKRRELGPRFHSQAMELGLMGIALASEGKQDAVRALFGRLRAEHPRNAETLLINALAENALGNRGTAVERVEQAYALGRETGVMPHRLMTYRNLAEQWRSQTGGSGS